MDSTQVLDFDEEEVENDNSKETVAFLKVNATGEFPETIFPVHEGENIIGRHDNCDITIPLQMVSKKHACIEVHGNHHFIYDYNSRNRTRRKKMFLKPQAFYELVNEIDLMIADVKCQYLLAETKDLANKEISDSGSETASESLMPDSEPGGQLNESHSPSPKKAENKGAIEDDLDEATQEYDFKLSEEKSSAVFCANSDSETEDEREQKNEPTAGTGQESHLDATIPCDTLPNTVAPNSIPETPFISDQALTLDQPSKLKRAVEVRFDSGRRFSAENTLAYGLSTLESLNSTRESTEVSENESGKEEILNEVNNKLDFENCTETPNKKNGVSDSAPKQDDDLLETQLYESIDVIPNSPRDSTCIPESPVIPGTPDETSDVLGSPDVFDNEISGDDMLNDRTSSFEKKTSEDGASEGKTSECKTSESETFGCKHGVQMPDDNEHAMEETQAYDLGGLGRDEIDDTATQAYGSTFDQADELAETQAYGDAFEVPEVNNVFKLPGAMNTQDLNGNVPENKGEMNVGNKEDFEEVDIQATQNYIDPDEKTLSTIERKCGVEANKYSDHLPSFSSMMDSKSDSENDFMQANILDVTPLAKSPTIDLRISPSMVIEGRSTSSSGKNCYVEIPTEGVETNSETMIDEQVSRTRKKSVRGRKTFAAQRRKGQQQKIEDQEGLLSIPAENDGINSEGEGEGYTPGDTNKQQENSATKRAKGRSTRGRKTAVSTRGSRTRGVKGVDVTKETGESKNEPIADLLSGRMVEATGITPPEYLQDTESIEKMEGGITGDVADPKTSRVTRKRKSALSIEPNKGGAKKRRRNTIPDETTEDVIQARRERTSSQKNDSLKVGTEECDISFPARSLSKPDSSSSSTVSTPNSNASRPRKKYNQDPGNHSCRVKIVFTGLPEHAVKKATKIVQDLGGRVVSRLEDSSHLVTDKVRRTVKLLCAISRGIPVVDMGWLDACKKTKSFVDSSGFIVNDKEAEEKYSFSLERSLELARSGGLLDGYKIHVTPHVKPPPADMQEIIKSAKGKVSLKMPTSRDNNVIVLSCDEDKSLCEKANIKSAYTAELLLTGILRQELGLEQNMLALDVAPELAKKGRRKR